MPRSRAVRPAGLRAAAVVSAAVLVLGGCGGASSPPAPISFGGPTGTPTASDTQWVREDSQRLTSTPDDRAVLVEFLDFECPACASFTPLMEELRADYEGEVSFVVRNLPLDVHPNSLPAAWAAEAAGEQGQYAAMYQALFSTQRDWAGKGESQEDLFRSYAEDLGLDLEQYDADVASEQVRDKVAQDRADAETLGVSGTPAFVLDGEIIQPESEEQLREALDAAVAG